MKEIIEVNYEEWLKNESNVNWSGWLKLKEIESTIGKMTYNDCDWLHHVYFFLNNYIQELEVKEFLNVEFIEDNHLALRNCIGKNIPDFIDANGETYEYKSTTTQNVYRLNEYNWHGADHKYVYLRDVKTLYCYDTGELVKVAHMEFNRRYPKWNIIKAYL